MVKKLKAAAKSDDKQMADAVRASAAQIWQAGLGAFAKAQVEGTKVFTKLVKEGTDLQRRTKSLAEVKISHVADTVNKVADNVSKQAAGSWDKLEQVFEDRVSRSLASLGVPSKAEVQELNKRVADLSKTIATLTGKKQPAQKAAPKAAKKAAVKKPAAKKAVAKKAVAKKPAAKPAAKKAAAKPVAA
jgi:poly(hydroxyalkanoate) granule-associated protein